MKNQPIAVALVFLLAVGVVHAGEHEGASTSLTSGRVGVYDSRVLAYAHFWSEPMKKQREDLVARAQTAKHAGDTVLLKALERQIAVTQKRGHLQIFSSAPADEAMAALCPKLPALQGELGVNRFISKWDATSLSGIPDSDRVDVTDRLMHEFFTPSERQQKIIDAMKAGKPLPLWQAKLLVTFGKL